MVDISDIFYFFSVRERGTGEIAGGRGSHLIKSQGGVSETEAEGGGGTGGGGMSAGREGAKYFSGPKGNGSGILFREYCFGGENSLGSVANSVSSEKNSVGSL